MSNQRTNHFGGGRRLEFRMPRVGHGRFVLCLILGMFVGAVSAEAAEIVEVRIGRHPEFTRVVFELDQAAGYRIERTDPSAAISELVVSLDATSIPRSLRSAKSFIERVEVSPTGARSVARIRLSRDGLKLKEMILANPPRIVLDVISDQPIAAARTPKASASSAAAKSAPKPTVTAESKPTAKPTSTAATSSAAGTTAARETASQAANAAATASKATASAAATAANAASKTQTPTAKADAPESPSPTRLAQQTASQRSGAAAGDRAAAGAQATPDDLAQADARTAAQAAGADEPSTSTSTPIDELDRAFAQATQGTANAGQPTDPRAAQAAAKPKKPRPMVVQKKKDDGGGWLTWALVGAGALVVLVGGVAIARRRGGSEEVDFSDEEEGDGAAEAAEVVSAEDENPFAGLTDEVDEATLASPDATTVTPFAEDDGLDAGDTTIVAIPDDEKESETVVFGGTEGGSDVDDMEVISRDQVNESLGGAMPPMGGIPEEFQQMMREMNRRVESLEGRIDELVDARDRLERQVAAQTEELRVQRAAIARTQRAVRNLARPEDAGEEEATEPALRDPNQPPAE